MRSGDNSTYPIFGDNVTVHYNGTFPTTGLSFDSSYSRNKSFSFMLNYGNVIKCWDNIVSKMSLGERVYVVCPYSEAYGTQGISNIPGSTDIAFDIDFLCINNNCKPKATDVLIPTANVTTNVTAVTGSNFILEQLGLIFITIIAILFA